MAQILITGAAGFIGSHCAAWALRHGHAVRGLDDLSHGSAANLEGLDVDLRVADVGDPAAVAAAMHGVDYVLHHAAAISTSGSLQAPLATHAVNVTATLGVLEAARRAGVQRLVLAASSAVYAELDPRAAAGAWAQAEPHPLAPQTPYAASKLAAEAYAQTYAQAYGLPVTVLRYFNVFGPRQHERGDYAAVVPAFVRAARGGRRPVIFGDGEQRRDFVFVEDVARANLLACEAPAAAGQTFNVGSGRATSVNALWALISELSGRAVQPRRAPARPGEVRASCADMGAAARLLGFWPRVELREGLRRTLAHTGADTVAAIAG